MSSAIGSDSRLVTAGQAGRSVTSMPPGGPRIMPAAGPGSTRGMMVHVAAHTSSVAASTPSVSVPARGADPSSRAGDRYRIAGDGNAPSHAVHTRAAAAPSLSMVHAAHAAARGDYPGTVPAGTGSAGSSAFVRPAYGPSVTQVVHACVDGGGGGGGLRYAGDGGDGDSSFIHTSAPSRNRTQKVEITCRPSWIAIVAIITGLFIAAIASTKVGVLSGACFVIGGVIYELTQCVKGFRSNSEPGMY